MLARACPSSVKSYPAPKSPTNCNFCLRFGSHPTFIPESLPPDRPTFEPANVPTCLGPIPFPFKLLRTLLHAQKLNSFFSIASALFAQKHPGGGRVSMWNSPSCGPRSVSVASCVASYWGFVGGSAGASVAPLGFAIVERVSTLNRL